MTPAVSFRGRRAALAMLCAMQLALAWLASLVVTVPSLAPLARHPDGVFALYTGGGRTLLSMLSRVSGELTMGAAALGLLALLWATLSFVFGATMPVLAVVEPAPSLHRAASYSLRRLTTLLGLGAVALTGWALGAVASFLAWGTLHRRAETMVDGRAADLLEARALVPVLAIGALVTVWHDVARVWAVGNGSGVRSATADALAVMARRPMQTLVSALGYALLGALGVVVAYVASRLWGGRGGAALVALTVTQQLALVWRFGCRARWIVSLGALHRALHPPPAGDEGAG